MIIETEDYLTAPSFAAKNNYVRAQINKYIRFGAIKTIIIDGKQFIHKDAVFKKGFTKKNS